MTTTTETPAAPEQVWANAYLALTPTMTMHRGVGDNNPKRHRAYDFYFGRFLTDMVQMCRDGIYGVKFSTPTFNADSEEISVFVEFAADAGSKFADALGHCEPIPGDQELTTEDIEIATRHEQDLYYEARKLLVERARTAGFSVEIEVTGIDSCNAPTQDA